LVSLVVEWVAAGASGANPEKAWLPALAALRLCFAIAGMSGEWGI
jgi:hypothetical protein